MNILLTGSTGFIGTFIRGNYLNVVSVLRGSNQILTPKFVISNFDSNVNWDGAFENVSSIIHLAGLVHAKAYTTLEYQEVNVKGTLHFAREAAKAGIKRFVFVSSIGVNGCSTLGSPFLSTSKPNPHSIYAQSKLDAELGLMEIASNTGLEVVIVRPTLVYGPNAPGNFDSLTRLVCKLPCLPFRLVNNRRDFISVQNLADLLVTCAKHPKAGGNTFLASDCDTVSIKKFTNAIADSLGTSLVQLPIPAELIRFAGKLIGKSAMVEQLVGNLEVDSSNLKEVLDWTPPYTMEQSMMFLKQAKKSIFI